MIYKQDKYNRLRENKLYIEPIKIMGVFRAIKRFWEGAVFGSS
jgi:hypothetical protein